MKRAIVRPPGDTFKGCLSTHPLHHTLNMHIALEQHKKYRQTLTDLGLDLIELEPDNVYPDACFVEDTVVVHGERAIITRMAKESRRGESPRVEEVLSEFKQIDTVVEPGLLEGGDVVHFPDSLICGITKRSNRDGAAQMKRWLEVPVYCIEDLNIMHIKSHLSYLGRNTVLVNEKYVGNQHLDSFEKIVLPPEESHSANIVAIDDTIIMSTRHKKTGEFVREVGFEVVHIDLSEFEKCDGALTCLSVIF
ncbi:MAG: dimethylarginine dimethylaminohydrolase family protein [Candidatus Thorarchaeota archaeon]